MKLAFLSSSALAASVVALLSGSAPERAHALSLTCNEGTGACSDGSTAFTTQGGIVVELTEPGGAGLKLASDGEITFDPFGAGYDTSDGAILSAGAGQTWTPNNLYGAFNPGYWTQIEGDFGGALYPNTWVLPAVIPGCGAENEPTCEPVAVWNYSAPLPDLTLTLLEADGTTYSDQIRIRTNPLTGDAVLLFASDPSTIPEPSTWAMLLIGFAGLGYFGYRSQKRRAAIAI